MFRCSRGTVAIGALAVLALGLSPAKADQGGNLPLCPENTTGFTATPGTNANPYFPLTSALEGTLVGPDSDGTTHGLRIKLGGFEMVGLVTTRIVEELEWHETNGDGLPKGEKLIEDSFNYFAQSLDDKTVCYFGEFVNNYDENGVLLPDDHHGSWRADAALPPANCIDPTPPALPGIQMLDRANVTQGARYQQESATCAQDVAQIASVDTTVTLRNGTMFSNVIRTKEGSLIETGAKEYKAYARGKGLVIDDTLERCTPKVNCSASMA